MIETLPDGRVVTYLTRDFEPAAKEDAELVKVVEPDGRVVFGVRDRMPLVSQRPATL